jgi:hypothetical protein
MMYSSAGIMGIEWEMIIKNYRDSLDKKPFDTLPEYAGDFINYLSKFPCFTEDQMKDCLRSLCFDVFSQVLNWLLDDPRGEFDGKEHTGKNHKRRRRKEKTNGARGGG